MSEFHVEVVRVGSVTTHENADSLSITRVYDYPVVFRTGDFHEGDLAVYVPVDSVVPEDDPRWVFLDGHTRIKAKRLRGVFSMGLLTPAEPGWTEGQDVHEELGIKKWVPPVDLCMETENEKDPGFIPVYTDIEGLRRHPDVLVRGEPVVVTEKIHGANARYCHDGARLWVGSHTRMKKRDERNMWWRAAIEHELETRLAGLPNYVFYGEVYGQVQDLQYGVPNGGLRLAFYDVFKIADGRYLDPWETANILLCADLEHVPILYSGNWTIAQIPRLGEGPSHVKGADCIREGFVVKPVRERYDGRLGRVILKYHGEEYLTRKKGKKK